MTSPNVQIQNLMRRYVRERDGKNSFDTMIQSLISPTGEIDMNDDFKFVRINSFVLPSTLQTTLLYNFKSSFEYKLSDLIELGEHKVTDFQEDNIQIKPIYEECQDGIFEMDDETLDKADLNISENTNDFDQYLGSDGIINNIFGGELVDAKWILYNFIISKIYKSFKTNMLNDSIKINSLHLGSDSGSVQATLNHLFTASNQFKDILVQWKWTSLSRSNELYNNYKSNFIPLLSVRTYWEQTTFIINKTSEIADRFNLIIYQKKKCEDDVTRRYEYLFAIIMALRFSDSQSVLLLEFSVESAWGLLEINILALCGLIYDSVYLTKYEVGHNYCVAICRDKKKNLNTNSLLKKLLKILLESDTLCIVDKSVFTAEWLEHIDSLIKLPMLPIRFMQIIENMKTSLFYNERPIY